MKVRLHTAVAVALWAGLGGLTGSAPQAQELGPDQARLCYMMVHREDVPAGLDLVGVRRLRGRGQLQREVVLRANTRTKVELDPEFLEALNAVLEQPGEASAGNFRVLFVFQWAGRPRRVELSRSKDRAVPDPPRWSLDANGASEWYVHDRLSAFDPLRSLEWTLAMTPAKTFEFAAVMPKTAGAAAR